MRSIHFLQSRLRFNGYQGYYDPAAEWYYENYFRKTMLLYKKYEKKKKGIKPWKN